MGCRVAPFVGAWIEIYRGFLLIIVILVAPFVGAWIEIVKVICKVVLQMLSLRSSERGLKLMC